MPGTVRVIAPGHQVREFSRLRVGFKRGQAIDQPNAIIGGETSNLLGVVAPRLLVFTRVSRNLRGIRN